LSGTTAGYAILQSCNNTDNWTNHFGTSADTFILADVTTDQIHKFHVGDINFKYYRVMWLTPSGTRSVKVSGSFSVRDK
jgi:hypothetical protein